MSKEEGAAGNSPSSGHVGKVKQDWQVREDWSLAQQLQDGEFLDHYDHNRTERKTVGGDIRTSKEEQKLEDQYAAEYWEQVRRDREREDERIALEIQRQLEEEENLDRMSRRRELEEKAKRDEELARQMQMAEERKKSAQSRTDDFDGFLAAKLQNLDVSSFRGANGRIALPSGLTPETLEAIRQAQVGEPIVLPNGMTPDQMKAIKEALEEEDRRVAQEAEDFELARQLQLREAAEMQMSSRTSPQQPSSANRSAPPRPKPPRPLPPNFQRNSQTPPTSLINFDSLDSDQSNRNRNPNQSFQ